MLVEIFGIGAQTEQIGRIEASVRRFVDEEAEVRGFDLFELEAARERYSKLLQASVDLVQSARVKGAYFHSPFYERIYLELTSRLYPTGWNIFRTREELQAFFPAIALRGRIVFVPVGFGDLLARTIGGADLPTPMGPLAVTELDTTQPEAVDRALSRLGDELRREVLAELAAYGSWRDVELDPREVARHLEVSPGFIGRVLEQGTALGDAYAKLRCELEVASLRLGRWTRVEVVVVNEGEEPFERVSLEMNGPVQVRPESLIFSVGPGKTVRFPIAIRADEPGEFPVEVKLRATRHRGYEPWLPGRYLWLDVVD